MATYSPEILYRKINDVQETFGGLSQTSQFMVTLNLGRSTIRQSGIGPLNRYLTRCGLFQQSKSTEETYDFLCSDASLPGSSSGRSCTEAFSPSTPSVLGRGLRRLSSSRRPDRQSVGAGGVRAVDLGMIMVMMMIKMMMTICWSRRRDGGGPC